MSSIKDNGSSERVRHTAEMKIFAVLTLVALLVALLGLFYQESTVFFFGLAFAIFSIFGVLYALAKQKRWLF
ncbi:MAG: hypothetical protein QW520_01460 [Methanomassiliicoccales archaeon]